MPGRSRRPDLLSYAVRLSRLLPQPDEFEAISLATIVRFAREWPSYWDFRGWSESQRFDPDGSLAAKAADLFMFAFRGMAAVTSTEAEWPDDDVPIALVLLLFFATDLVVLPDRARAGLTHSDYPMLRPPDADTIAVRVGLADRCARLATPLTASSGEALGATASPLGVEDALALMSSFGDRQTTLVAGQARTALAEALAAMLPACRDALDTDNATLLPDARLAELAAAGLYTAQVAGHALRSHRATEHTPDDPLIVLSEHLAGALHILSRNPSTADHDMLNALTLDLITYVDKTVGGINDWIASALSTQPEPDRETPQA